MLGGDSSSSQQWGMEEDEAVFLKQVTPCPISSLRQEAGADLSFWVPQLSCPRSRQVSSKVRRCPKSKVIFLKIKWKKIGERHFWEARRGMTWAGVLGCQSQAWILPLWLHAGLGVLGDTQT